jgi:hypothetical protein
MRKFTRDLPNPPVKSPLTAAQTARAIAAHRAKIQRPPPRIRLPAAKKK